MGQTRGRLRSSTIALPTIAVLGAAALASCSGQSAAQQRVCVDANQNVTSQIQCQPGGLGHYYYYGSSSGFSSGLGIGSHVSGGSFSSGGSSSGSSSADASRVGRGGFGGHGGSE